MADNKVNMPSGFGGLTRFSDEYSGGLHLKPTHVIGFIILVILFRVLLGVVYA